MSEEQQPKMKPFRAWVVADSKGCPAESTAYGVKMWTDKSDAQYELGYANKNEVWSLVHVEVRPVREVGE